MRVQYGNRGSRSNIRIRKLGIKPYMNVGGVWKMKVWKRRVRRSRLEKLSLTSPPEALKWAAPSLLENPRTWDVWLPEWYWEGATDGDSHGSCHLRKLRLLCSSSLRCRVQAPRVGLGCWWSAEPVGEMQSRGEQGQGGASFCHLVRLTTFQEQ